MIYISIVFLVLVILVAVLYFKFKIKKQLKELTNIKNNINEELNIHFNSVISILKEYNITNYENTFIKNIILHYSSYKNLIIKEKENLAIKESKKLLQITKNIDFLIENTSLKLDKEKINELKFQAGNIELLIKDLYVKKNKHEDLKNLFFIKLILNKI